MTATRTRRERNVARPISISETRRERKTRKPRRRRGQADIGHTGERNLVESSIVM